MDTIWTTLLSNIEINPLTPFDHIHESQNLLLKIFDCNLQIEFTRVKIEMIRSSNRDDLIYQVFEKLRILISGVIVLRNVVQIVLSFDMKSLIPVLEAVYFFAMFNIPCFSNCINVISKLFDVLILQFHSPF